MIARMAECAAELPRQLGLRLEAHVQRHRIAEDRGLTAIARHGDGTHCAVPLIRRMVARQRTGTRAVASRAMVASPCSVVAGSAAAMRRSGPTAAVEGPGPLSITAAGRMPSFRSSQAACRLSGPEPAITMDRPGATAAT